MWRPEFLPHPEQKQGVLTVETVKKNVLDDTYIYYNFDHYIDNDQNYKWYGFTTTNENFTLDTYYICNYGKDSGLIASTNSDHDEEDTQTSTLSPEESDPCHCTSAHIALNGLDDSQTFQSPQYPKNYCSDANCKWFVSTPDDLAIQIDWLVFSLENNMDFVYIHEGHDPNSPIIKECTGWKCGNQRSSGNKLLIHFYTDHVTTDLGFRARVTAVQTDACYCSGSLKVELVNLLETFSIHSPGYPQSYCVMHNCQWTLTAPPSFGLHVSFKNFDIQNDHDYLYIYDGGQMTDDMIGKCTGTNCADRISSGNQMYIMFVTDPTESNDLGFQGIVTVVQNYCLQKDIHPANRTVDHGERYAKELSYSNARDDGFIAVGGNATIICANNSKIQGTDHSTFDIVTCESPNWNRYIGVCVPACNLEYHYPEDHLNISTCKLGDTEDKPDSMIESGGTVTIVPYDFLNQQAISKPRIFTCNGNSWADNLTNSYRLIRCHNIGQGPKIRITGGRSEKVELYYPTNPHLNRILDDPQNFPQSYAAGAMISDGSIVICGGILPSDQPQDLCERYFPETNQVLATRPLNGRRGAAAAVLNGIMYLCGGEDATIIGLPPGLPKVYTRTCERYVPDVGWRYIASMIKERFGLAMAAYNGKLVAIGGEGSGGTVEAYTPARDSWSQFPRLKNFEPTEHKYAAAAVMEGKLFVCGGYPPINSCQQYNHIKREWMFVADMIEHRYGFSMVTIGDKIYALGGLDLLDVALDTVEMFNGHVWVILETKLLRQLDGITAVLVP